MILISENNYLIIFIYSSQTLFYFFYSPFLATLFVRHRSWLEILLSIFNNHYGKIKVLIAIFPKMFLNSYLQIIWLNLIRC